MASSAPCECHLHDSPLTTTGSILIILLFAFTIWTNLVQAINLLLERKETTPTRFRAVADPRPRCGQVEEELMVVMVVVGACS